MRAWYYASPTSSWRKPGPIPRNLSSAIGRSTGRLAFAKQRLGVMGPGFRQDGVEGCDPPASLWHRGDNRLPKRNAARGTEARCAG
ncbi:hypothetical protein EAS62_33065 [Bradyrhizobium zhanjiangense]|uniref:Uncharacterized protein n=1 Tax=Bradyrhizobium zhanjiangense TaxID=1325107 RepID=A0ABY0DBF7_9BRAD|nr:hypothetical protein EAS62_33065 [Bradyrhizobium zhanjiangense]